MKTAHRLGAVAAFVLAAYCVGTMIQMLVLGVPPTSAAEAFRLLRENRVVGLLRLDLPTSLVTPVYYVLFLALYAALKEVDRWVASLGAVLASAGLTLFLAAPAALSMAALSDKYAAATTEAARAQFLAAGEAVLATDIWHGTGALIGGVLMQAGALLLCVLMLRAGAFGKVAAWIGIAMYGLDLLHVFAMPVLPQAGTVLMMVAGPLYPVWFLLVGLRLRRLVV